MTMARIRRFVARRSGLASGLALAVRPAGLAEVSGVNSAPQAHRRRVPRSGMRSTVEAGGASPASRSAAATWRSTRPAACWSAGAWPATPPCPPGPPRSSSPSLPPPPAPACAWCTAACPPTRQPCTPPAGSIFSAGSPGPRRARTPGRTLEPVHQPQPLTTTRGRGSRIGHPWHAITESVCACKAHSM